MRTDIPPTHPRYHSLLLRERISDGIRDGITTQTGLIAHGRGEAFDYLLGEITHPFALNALQAAAHRLTSARFPVLSANGNIAALAPKEYSELANALNAPIQVNIFHPSREREEKIRETFLRFGANKVLLPGDEALIPGLDSNRRRCHPEGITRADVVVVPLEDGDRTEALVAMKKCVVTIDLNPNSRSAKRASITIVDNLIRTFPLLTRMVLAPPTPHPSFSNEQNLALARIAITEGFRGTL